ncbi:MAG: peptidoglycan-binding protein [Propionibacteriaceae bacterium]|nr:peptidoglycan-binding protein [Propionibacteriaceae bacterium]
MVTRVAVAVGQEVGPGQVLAEVSGRPVFALAGVTPAYRDLRPGYEGDDVRQLQQDLADMGFDPGAIDGVFGAPTKTAVESFYQSIGYPAPSAGEADEQQERQAAAGVRQAQWAVEDAQTALSEAAEALRKAQAAKAQADWAATANPDPTAAQAAAAQAELVETAERTVRQAQTALERAQRQSAEAQTDQAETSARTGPMVPLGEYAFIPSFPARVTSLPAQVGAAAPMPLLTLASGQLQASGTVNPSQAALLTVGQPVAVLLEAGDVQATGQVASLEVIADPGSAAGSSQIVVTPDGDWPAEFWGQNVRLTIDGGSTEGAELVVPVSALFASADGSTRLTVVTDGKTTDLVVTVGLTANGYAAVRPASGQLRAGDQVAVSADNAPGGG